MRRVDYDEAVRAYEARLDTELRGFGAGDALLAPWVPDADPAKGILNLFEAAEAAGLEAIEVAVGPETSRALDLALLEERAAELGELTVGGDDELVLRLRLGGGRSLAASAPQTPRAARARPPEPSRVAPLREPLHPSYLARARERAPSRRETPGPEDDAALEARVHGLRLRIWVDDEGRLVRARHDGEVSDVARAIDLWCELVEGLPIEEACEHGAHRLMEALRDPDAPPPVPGVVTPRNASPIFAALLEAGRELLRAHADRTGAMPPDSTHHPAPSPAWAAMGDDARLAAIREALGAACEEAELDPSEVEAAGVRDVIKVRLDFADSVPIAQRRRALLRLEAALQRLVEPTLVVEREARRDLNVLRRL